MPIKCELGNDTDRGPGHGILRISGLRSSSEQLDFTLMRNQGTEPYLGRRGAWQGEESLLQADVFSTEGGDVRARVGPEVVDAIGALPSNVAFQLAVVTERGKERGTLKVDRPLFGSGAAAPERASVRATPPPKPPEPVSEEPETTPVDLPPDREPVPESPVEEVVSPPIREPDKRGFPWLVALVVAFVIAVAGIGYWGYSSCWFPGIGHPQCETQEPAPVPTSESEPAPESEPTPEPEPGPESEPTPEPEPGPTATPPRASCEGLDAERCYKIADEAQTMGDLVRARELYQRAVRLGSVKASIRLGEMYDPDSWSKKTSPQEGPDWETAAYWYEDAARQGDTEGLVAAGRVLCRHGTSALERSRGLDFLKRASAQGVAQEISALMSDCGGNTQ